MQSFNLKSEGKLSTECHVPIIRGRRRRGEGGGRKLVMWYVVYLFSETNLKFFLHLAHGLHGGEAREHSLAHWKCQCTETKH